MSGPRFDQCGDDCTTDCGHCKGVSRAALLAELAARTVERDQARRAAERTNWQVAGVGALLEQWNREIQRHPHGVDAAGAYWALVTCHRELQDALAGPGEARDQVTSVEPGCACGGMAACEQCQARDQAAEGEPATEPAYGPACDCFVNGLQVELNPDCPRHGSAPSTAGAEPWDGPSVDRLAQAVATTTLERGLDDALVAALATDVAADRPRLFALERTVDVSGVSGTGTVAYGVLFPDGRVATRWNAGPDGVAQTCAWDSIHDVEAIHGHGGATVVRWLDESEA